MAQPNALDFLTSLTRGAVDESDRSPDRIKVSFAEGAPVKAVELVQDIRGRKGAQAKQARAQGRELQGQGDVLERVIRGNTDPDAVAQAMPGLLEGLQARAAESVQAVQGPAGGGGQQQLQPDLEAFQQRIATDPRMGMIGQGTGPGRDQRVVAREAFEERPGILDQLLQDYEQLQGIAANDDLSVLGRVLPAVRVGLGSTRDLASVPFVEPARALSRAASGLSVSRNEQRGLQPAVERMLGGGAGQPAGVAEAVEAPAPAPADAGALGETPLDRARLEQEETAARVAQMRAAFESGDDDEAVNLIGDEVEDSLLTQMQDSMMRTLIETAETQGVPIEQVEALSNAMFSSAQGNANASRDSVQARIAPIMDEWQSELEEVVYSQVDSHLLGPLRALREEIEETGPIQGSAPFTGNVIPRDVRQREHLQRVWQNRIDLIQAAEPMLRTIVEARSRSINERYKNRLATELGAQITGDAAADLTRTALGAQSALLGERLRNSANVVSSMMNMVSRGDATESEAEELTDWMVSNLPEVVQVEPVSIRAAESAGLEGGLSAATLPGVVDSVSENLALARQVVDNGQRLESQVMNAFREFGGGENMRAVGRAAIQDNAVAQYQSVLNAIEEMVNTAELYQGLAINLPEGQAGPFAGALEEVERLHGRFNTAIGTSGIGAIEDARAEQILRVMRDTDATGTLRGMVNALRQPTTMLQSQYRTLAEE